MNMHDSSAVFSISLNSACNYLSEVYE